MIKYAQKDYATMLQRKANNVFGNMIWGIISFWSQIQQSVDSEHVSKTWQKFCSTTHQSMRQFLAQLHLLPWSCIMSHPYWQLYLHGALWIYSVALRSTELLGNPESSSLYTCVSFLERLVAKSHILTNTLLIRYSVFSLLIPHLQVSKWI